MADGQHVLATVRAFVQRVNNHTDVDLDTSLYGDGIGFDSLEIGELGALLEDTYGSDPFLVGREIETVGDIIAFYDASNAV